MPENANSQVQAKVWLEPEQIESLRSACYQTGADYLQQRNEAIITLMYDSGLRVGELVQVDVDMLRDAHSALYLPGHIQKDYPTDNSPSAVTIKLDDETGRLLSAYLTNRWKNTDALFPARSSDRMSTQAIRNALEKIAVQAEVQPFDVDGGRRDPDDVTPHALRHSVAYRMLHEEEGNTLYDVRNRLRHRSIQTTERIYDHFRTV